MNLDALKGWTPTQKHVVTAGFLGWMLDAFDFFLLVFVITDVAKEFGYGENVAPVALALTLTLGFRPIGAFVFGRLADRYGRRPILMLDVALYSVLAFATAFAPNLTVFLILRALFGIAMGGEWGTGASLTMETVRPESRGFVSGLLQSGYPCGYLLASIVFAILYPFIGWRGMFMVGILPALLILYIRRHVPESPGWAPQAREVGGTVAVLRSHWPLALFAILLMTAFNFFSHGTQDLYPTFLQTQHGFGHATVSTIAIVYNIGAIVGGIGFGMASQRYGRRRMIVIGALLSILVAPLWAFAPTAALLGLGAFLMQVCVQGCWGVIPAHLNEISPPEARGTFPGTVYQLGNFIASSNASLQVWFAGMVGGKYSIALATVAVAAAIVIAILASLSREAKDAVLHEGPTRPAPESKPEASPALS
ncbi:MAG TPA: MFS transporter [Gammaproteobacteria bacterium]|nr:MFS transporter [Gammaproteobacteria bacterium]